MDKSKSLPPEILRITQDKGTEPPFSGEYDEWDQPGTYLCRQCGLALFRAKAKFHSGCGWPSFDQEINGAVRQQTDMDGHRTEILCQRCGAHLGHVFQGESMTPLNTRHCVNSLSLEFVSDLQIEDTEEAIFAAGCFWGVEYFFKRLPGVLKTEVGYTGGHKDHPTYEEICQGNTGHYEAIRVLYDPKKITYERVVKFFFEIHDPTQTNGQGPDIGQQYLSAIFYYHEDQKKVALGLRQLLNQQGYLVSTQILPITIFWQAEDYHQDYYQKTHKEPYCHRYIKRF